MNIQSVDRYEDEPADLRVMVAKLVAARWWVIASVVVSTALFITAAFVIKPVYRATVVLIPASAERNSMSGSLNSALGQLGGLAALAGLGTGSGDAATEEALAVLRSRQFTERFIMDLKLMPELFAARWDAASGKWKPSEHGPPTPARAFRSFSNIRTITQDKKTGLVTLDIDWKDRNRAANWANELAVRLNTEMRMRAIAQAEASLKFLEQELATTSTVDTREAINRLIEAQIKQRMLANVTQEYAFRVVDRAMPPDSDDPLRPQKLLLFLLGPFVGLSLGIVAVLGFDLLFGKRPDKR